MSRQRKTAAVLRLLRGEDLETVSRELGVTAATLTGWHDAFLAGGEAALTSRPGSGEELQSDRLKARLGAALIERDLLNENALIGSRHVTVILPCSNRSDERACPDTAEDLANVG